jgi:hypothetical protein
MSLDEGDPVVPQRGEVAGHLCADLAIVGRDRELLAAGGARREPDERRAGVGDGAHDMLHVRQRCRQHDALRPDVLDQAAQFVRDVFVPVVARIDDQPVVGLAAGLQHARLHADHVTRARVCIGAWVVVEQRDHPRPLAGQVPRRQVGTVVQLGNGALDFRARRVPDVRLLVDDARDRLDGHTRECGNVVDGCSRHRARLFRSSAGQRPARPFKHNRQRCQRTSSDRSGTSMRTWRTRPLRLKTSAEREAGSDSCGQVSVAPSSCNTVSDPAGPATSR